MKLRSLLFAVTLLSISHTFAQNVGVGNTSPNSKLDVSGDLALREGTAITVSSGNNIITLPPAKNSVYRLTGATGAFTINAISAGNDGMTLTLINATGQVMTVRDSASIRTNINADLIGSTTVSSLSLIYNATIGKWIVTGSEGYNTSAANAWNTTGNTGTTTANFMGTKDNNPLYFKTNNTVAGFLPSSTTGNIYFGVNTSIPTYANENVGIGNTALSVNTTGVANVAIGQSALLQNSTGNANTAIGYSSLEANTFGSNNVGVGINSLLSNRTGSSNVALGFNAIQTDTSGSYNVGLGLSALNNLLIGSKNVAIGDSAGYSELGSNSVFIGPYAGYSETGSNKLYISNSNTSTPLIYGDFNNQHLTVNDSLTAQYIQMTNGAVNGYLLQSDASGNATWVSPSSIAANNIYNSNGTLTGNRTMTMAGDTLDLNGGTLSTNQDALVHGMTVGLGSGIYPSNTAVGAGVLKSNTGGINNTATGYDALTSNTIGGRNTATGSGALYSNTSGGSNTASGYDALYSNISGNSNTANGTSALTANTTGAGNTASGSSALSSNTTGSNNTANGMNALLNTTTGSGNSANGVYALQKNSTGGNNTATGNSALFSNTSGFGNTANGNLALFNDTTGGHNVALGDSAGFSNVTGNANTYVGFAANASAATLSNATAIGANAYAGASNSMVLGAISGVNGATSSTNVGIGTTTPDTTLQVVGKTQTTYLQMTNGAAANYLLQGDASGNATWVSPSSITTGTTNTLTNTTNTITSTVNGKAATAPAVNTNVLTISGDSITSTINGVASNKVSLSARNWSVTGNAGTTASNFLGTTDNNPLYIKTNGAQVAYLPAVSSDNIYLGLNTGYSTGTQNIDIGNYSGGYSSGSNNIALGVGCLQNDVSGTENIAIGSQVMFLNSTGSYNVGIGNVALSFNTTGSSDLALGSGAAYSNKTGSSNVALGNSALNKDTAGNYNVAVGINSGYSNNGSGNVFLGYEAGYNETGSNKLYISNNNTSTPLIYGDFTNQHLTVNDSLTAQYLQMTNGAAANYLLQSDASGNATWVSPSTIAAQNIYNTDGTLTGNRTVTDGANNLTFSSSTGNLYFNTTSGVNLTSGGNIAMGNTLTATGGTSVAFGTGNTASGTASFATGWQNNATGTFSTVFGQENTASGYGSFATGTLCAASATFTLASGHNNTASGYASAALGEYTYATGYASMALGENTHAYSYGELTVGLYNTSYTPSSSTAYAATDRVFDVGNGSSGSALSDAMTILKNGNVGIGNASPNGTFDVLPSGGKDVILGGGSTTGSELKLTYGGVQHFSIYNSGNNKLTFAQTSVNIAPNQAGTALMTIDGSGNVNVPVLTASSQVYTDASKNLTSAIPTSGALGYWTRNSASAYLYNSTLTDKVGIGTATPPATLAVNGNAVIGTGQTVRSGNGLTVDYTSTTTYAANTDETDAARGLNIVNEGATANEMAVLAMRTNPTGGANNQMFDLKLVNPNNGAANLIYSFGPNDAFADRFTMTSAGAMGFGTTTPQGQLSNTANNIIGSDGNGTNVNSLVWAMSGLSGFVGAFYNGDGAVSNAHGLAVKIAGTASGNKILDLSTGAAQGTAGTVVMDVFGNGYVGIGTAAPTTTLDVNGSTVIRGTGNTNTPVTPASVLEIMSGRNSTSALASGQTTADIAVQYGGGGFRHFIASRHNAATSVNTNAIDFYLNNSTTSTGSSAPGTGNVEVMSITEQGVGIGTSAPVNELQVEGNQHMDGNPIYFRSGPTDHFDFIRWSTTGTGGASGDRLDVAGYAGVNLGYTSSGTGGTLVNVLTATNGGQVGIGTTAPAYTLDVAGNGRFNNGSGTFVYVGPGGGAYYGDGTNLVTQIPTGGSFFMANYGINGTNVAQATGSMRIGGPGQLTAALNIQSMSTGSDGPIYSDASGNVLKNTACPSGFTQVDVGLTRLCVIYSSTAGSWNASETTCTNLSGSSICYYLQIQKACNLGYYFNNATNTWLADHDGDDTFIATNAVVSNSTNCGNFDEGSGRGSSFPVFCCLEYMKF